MQTRSDYLKSKVDEALLRVRLAQKGSSALGNTKFDFETAVKDYGRVGTRFLGMFGLKSRSEANTLPRVVSAGYMALWRSLTFSLYRAPRVLTKYAAHGLTKYFTGKDEAGPALSGTLSYAFMAAYVYWQGGNIADYVFERQDPSNIEKLEAIPADLRHPALVCDLNGDEEHMDWISNMTPEDLSYAIAGYDAYHDNPDEYLVYQAILRINKETGISMAFWDALAKGENGFGRDVVANSSSARSLWQIINGTWYYYADQNIENTAYYQRLQRIQSAYDQGMVTPAEIMEGIAVGDAVGQLRAINHSLNAYREATDKRRFIARLAYSQSASDQEFLSLRGVNELSTGLVAQEVVNNFPDLMSEVMRGADEETFTKIALDFKRSHFLGEPAATNLENGAVNTPQANAYPKYKEQINANDWWKAKVRNGYISYKASLEAIDEYYSQPIRQSYAMTQADQDAFTACYTGELDESGMPEEWYFRDTLQGASRWNSHLREEFIDAGNWAGGKLGQEQTIYGNTPLAHNLAAFGNGLQRYYDDAGDRGIIPATVDRAGRITQGSIEQIGDAFDDEPNIDRPRERVEPVRPEHNVADLMDGFRDSGFDPDTYSGISGLNDDSFAGRLRVATGSDAAKRVQANKDILFWLNAADREDLALHFAQLQIVSGRAEGIDQQALSVLRAEAVKNGLTPPRPLQPQ